MRQSWLFLAVGGAILCTLGMTYAEEQTYPPVRDSSSVPAEEHGLSGRQDGRLVRPLKWVSPDGRGPGTYREYLESHPLAPAQFGMPSVAKPSGPGIQIAAAGFQSVSILVDKDLSKGRKVSAALEQYRADLVAEGYTVYTDTISGGTPQQIRSWVQSRYAAGSRMIVFVGGITAAWAKVPTQDDTFPSDLYYMDVDGYWADTDGDGVFDVHNAGAGDEGPEVCIARLCANTLDYASEDTLVGEYLDKVHNHRMGALKQPWRALEYIDEDWYDMDVFTRRIFGLNTTRCDLGYYTTCDDYFDHLSLAQYYVQVCNHGSASGHSFGTKPTESVVYAHVYVYSPSVETARLWLGADDGVKAWWNGALVLTRDVAAGWEADKYHADIQIQSGWNRLLCKVSQKGGDFELSARMAERRGDDALADLKYQVVDPDTHSSTGEFIRGWLVCGFHQDTSDRFYDYIGTNYLGTSESAVNPTAGQIMGGKTWTVHSSSSDYVDFAGLSEAQNYGAYYAFATVTSTIARTCQMWIGYGDGARVWLNGNEVLNDNRYGDFAVDMQKVNVTLKQGKNRLLVKVTQWLGQHGFSLRFCRVGGGELSGLTYDPVPDPITHVGTWAVNGPYANEEESLRLSTDYLGDEANVRPSVGDSAPVGTWELALGSGAPFDIGRFYDHGGWVTSEDVQDLDPPALFYNLFVCGAGRFTEKNFLAGSYIFHTRYGLCVVASAKTGSMLSFDDFTGPLGDGKTMGESFVEWFSNRLPFEDWEREWFYGMALFGDPTLHMFYGDVREPLPLW